MIERRSLKGELGQIHPRLNECVLVEYLQRGERAHYMNCSYVRTADLPPGHIQINLRIVGVRPPCLSERWSRGCGLTRPYSADKFVLKDVRDVNDALWRCEQADEEDAQAVKAASLWSTRTRRRTGESRDLKTDRLETFISERRRYVTRALEVSRRVQTGSETQSDCCLSVRKRVKSRRT